MLSYLVSLSMYMFTINQNMKVPFHLTKGSSLDLYAIVPGMSVVFSSTYNLNVTVSTKYSNLVYQSQEFSNETNSTRRNLKSVNFGAFTGRLRVVALEDTYFVYETIRGEYDKNDTCIIKEDDFTAEEANKKPIPPNNQHDKDDDNGFIPFPLYPQRPGDNNHNYPSPPNHHHPGDNTRDRPSPPYHQRPDDRHMHYPGNQRNHPGKENNVNFNADSFSFDTLFDSFFSIIISIGFIALGIALVVSVVRACKRNHCCGPNNSYNQVDDASIPPIIEQVDNFEQYIPPSNGNQRHNHQTQQPVQHIHVNYPQLQPIQAMQQPTQVPIMIPAQQKQPQNVQPIQPNYYNQPPIFVQYPMPNAVIVQGQPKQ